MMCCVLTVTHKPVPSWDRNDAPFLFQTCTLGHLLAFCCYFSLVKSPLMFIFNAFLFDENTVEEGDDMICPNPSTLLCCLAPE